MRSARRAARSTTAAAALCALCVLFGLACPGHSQDAYDDVWNARSRDLADPSLHVRTLAWLALAETRDARAFAALVLAYDRPAETENGRALIASAVCDQFDRPEDVANLVAWRERHARSEHAWLWYRTLLREIEHRGPDRAVATVRSSPPAWIQAVTLQSLAASAEPTALALLSGTPDSLPSKSQDRALVVEALADVLASQAGRLGDESYRLAARWLVDRLDDSTILPRTRLHVARCLARVLKPPRFHMESAYWRDLLSDQVAPVDYGRYAPPPEPSFFYLTGTGTRVMYVIDISSSMETPLTDEERRELQKKPPVVTGRASPSGPPQKKKSPLDPESLEIPWDRIQRRIDAAVEFLKLSIRLLPRDAWFGVVVFSTRHSFLSATPGLVRATGSKVAAALKEVEQYRTSFGGSTNLHGALRRALTGDPDRPTEWLEAPSTIFILSDGFPCTDDWSASGDFPIRDWRGTYSDGLQLLDDVERMNLFRQCEIHGVSIGGMGQMLPRAVRNLRGVQIPTPLFGDYVLALTRLGHGLFRAVPTPKAWIEDAASPLRHSTPWSVLIDALRSPGPHVNRDGTLAELERRAGTSFGRPVHDREYEWVRLHRNWSWWWQQRQSKSGDGR